jgi:threonine/homoserine/homoserine lactone efflux protein
MGAGASRRNAPIMHQAASVLFTISILWSAAVIAPGPNFLITTRTALLHDRAAGMQIALGIACGAAVWGLAGFFGVHALFMLAPWLYLGLKLAGSAYLIVLGIRFCRDSFRVETASAHHVSPPSRGSAVWRGFLTSVANPQTTLSIASLFAATLPPQPSLLLGLGAVAVMAMIAIAWYGTVACVLTLRPAAAVFARIHRWIDRIAGLAFIGLGTRLALER